MIAERIALLTKCIFSEMPADGKPFGGRMRADLTPMILDAEY
jgi:hypothetical protein